MFKVKNTRRNIRRSVSPTVTTPVATQTQSLDVPDAARKRTGMLTFFEADTATALQRPWLRLDRGQRLQRLRQFAEEYAGLTTEERESLYKVLTKANDAKALNTKQQIQYEEGKIVSIRGLHMTRVGDAAATFRIEAVPTAATRTTKKKATATATATTTSEEPTKKIEES
jgi:hypothetical protein